MEKIECSYRKNEWVAVYVDDYSGERQAVPFNTYEEAEKFLQGCYCKIGVMTTRFYNHYVMENPA